MIIDDKNRKKQMKKKFMVFAENAEKNAENCTKILTLIFVCVGSKNKNLKN